MCRMLTLQGFFGTVTRDKLCSRKYIQLIFLGSFKLILAAKYVQKDKYTEEHSIIPGDTLQREHSCNCTLHRKNITILTAILLRHMARYSSISTAVVGGLSCSVLTCGSNGRTTSLNSPFRLSLLNSSRTASSSSSLLATNSELFSVSRSIFRTSLDGPSTTRGIFLVSSSFRSAPRPVAAV